MSYDSKDPFRKFLKSYFYLFSFVESKITPAQIQRVFDPLLEALSASQEGIDYDFCTFLNDTVSEGTGALVHDLYISYNPNFRIDERALRDLIRAELVQLR